VKTRDAWHPGAVTLWMLGRIRMCARSPPPGDRHRVRRPVALRLLARVRAARASGPVAAASPPPQRRRASGGAETPQTAAPCGAERARRQVDGAPDPVRSSGGVVDRAHTLIPLQGIPQRYRSRSQASRVFTTPRSPVKLLAVGLSSVDVRWTDVGAMAISRFRPVGLLSSP